MGKPGLNKIYLFFAFIVIVAVGFSVYLNSFSNEFVWDDDVLVVDNLHIRSLKSLPQIFSTGLFKIPGGGAGSYYRPLQLLTYMLDYKIGQLNPAVFHITNVVIHIAGALLFCLIVSAVCGRVLPGMIAALLFVVHPIHTQAVTYVSGRADPLCVFFMLLSFLFFMRFLDGEGGGFFFYTLSFLSFAAAVLSKEMGIICPLFFLLYFYSFNRRLTVGLGRKLMVLPFFLAAGLYIFLRFTVLNFSEGTFLAQTPLYLRLLTAMKNIFAYLGLLLMPLDLHMEREVVFIKSFFEFKVFFSFLVLVMLLRWVYERRQRNPQVVFFAGWFIVGLLPVSNVFALNASLAEHWLYLPSMGIFALLALGYVKLFNFLRRYPVSLRLEAIIILIAALVTYGTLTVKRNVVWRTMLSIYTDTAKHVPRNYKVRNNLGRAYSLAGRWDEALEEFKLSTEIQPRYAYAQANLGFAYAHQGRYEEAVPAYNQALKLNPALAKTYLDLAAAYLKMNDLPAALETYQEGSKYCPDDAYLRSMFALFLAQQGRKEEALRHAEKAVALAPQNSAWHYNLAIVYEHNAQGVRYGEGVDLEPARAAYLKAIELDKDNAVAYCNLAVLYEFNSAGARYGPGFNYHAAESNYLKALRLDPEDNLARDNLRYLRDNFPGGVALRPSGEEDRREESPGPAEAEPVSD